MVAAGSDRGSSHDRPGPRWKRQRVPRRAVLRSAPVFGTVGLSGCIGSLPGSESGGEADDTSGTGFIPTPAMNKVESWGSFEVVAAFDGTYDDPRAGERTRTLDQAPDCGDDEPVTFNGYRIKRSGGDLEDPQDIAILFIGPDQTVATDVELVVDEAERGCQGVLHGGGKGTHGEDTTRVEYSRA